MKWLEWTLIQRDSCLDKMGKLESGRHAEERLWEDTQGECQVPWSIATHGCGTNPCYQLADMASCHPYVMDDTES